ncbi:hypothetical protein [Pseudomonas sp. WPR_5_2]|uniref:hypothetical protein n=1 Tax=Pseudomonas sp. WPR_5_2 TaxID=1907371 RepID=UPI0013141654|nr:hypothetical protein [Pseudomonas sp. WPR_5_2]
METTAPDFTVLEKQKTSEVRHRTTLAEVKAATHDQRTDAQIPDGEIALHPVP